jgi:hypothetical protein
MTTASAQASTTTTTCVCLSCSMNGTLKQLQTALEKDRALEKQIRQRIATQEAAEKAMLLALPPECETKHAKTTATSTQTSSGSTPATNAPSTSPQKTAATAPIATTQATATGATKAMAPMIGATKVAPMVTTTTTITTTTKTSQPEVKTGGPVATQAIIMLFKLPTDYKFIPYEGFVTSKINHARQIKDGNRWIWMQEIILSQIKKLFHFLQRNVYHQHQNREADVAKGLKTQILCQCIEMMAFQLLLGINTKGGISSSDFKHIQALVKRNTVDVPFKDRYAWAQTEVFSQEAANTDSFTRVHGFEFIDDDE